MIFTAQDLEQLKAAGALFARLSKEAAEWREEYAAHQGDDGKDGRRWFDLDELSGVLDDMAVSVEQIFRDHLPSLEGAENGPRETMTKEDAYLRYVDTMRECAAC